jgi:hypothetical protein
MKCLKQSMGNTGCWMLVTGCPAFSGISAALQLALVAGVAPVALAEECPRTWPPTLKLRRAKGLEGRLGISFKTLRISDEQKTGDMSDRFVLDKLSLFLHIVFAIRESRITNGVNYDTETPRCGNSSQISGH